MIHIVFWKMFLLLSSFLLLIDTFLLDLHSARLQCHCFYAILRQKCNFFTFLVMRRLFMKLGFMFLNFLTVCHSYSLYTFMELILTPLWRISRSTELNKSTDAVQLYGTCAFRDNYLLKFDCLFYKSNFCYIL